MLFETLFFLNYGSRREPEEPEDASKGRDVFNEKPPPDELLAASDIGKSVTTSLPDNVVSFQSIVCAYFKVCNYYVVKIGETLSLGMNDKSLVKFFLFIIYIIVTFLFC